MEMIKDKTYHITAKLEGSNVGDHFCNITLVTEKGERINVKLDKLVLPTLLIGKLYVFNIIVAEKNELELFYQYQSHQPVEVVYDQEKLTELANIFYQQAPISIKEIKESIEGYIAKIKNKVLKDIVSDIYHDNVYPFYLHPAATKFHHAYMGGLSYHTLTMLKLVDAFMPVYPFLNYELLIAATLLHDMAKIQEISGVEGEYTTEGLLIGHLVLGSIDIDRVANKYGYQNEEAVLLLKHMVLSHHGQLIFGSPKKPQTGEALLLWYIDSIDSKFAVLGEQLASTKEGEFTPSIPVLDKMRFYKNKKI